MKAAIRVRQAVAVLGLAVLGACAGDASEMPSPPTPAPNAANARQSDAARNVIDRVTAQFVSRAELSPARPGTRARMWSVLGSSVVDRLDRHGAWFTPHVAAHASRGAKRASVELPADASGTARVRDEGSGVGVELRLRGARPRDGEPVNGYVVYRGVLASGADLIHRATAEGTEDLVAFWNAPAAPELAYDVDLVSGVAGLRLAGNSLEFLDASGTPRLRVSPPFVMDAHGARCDAVLTVLGCTVDSNPAAPWGRSVVPPGASRCAVHVTWPIGIAYPALVDPTWTTTGSMATARYEHTATVLQNGRVLAAGGGDAVYVTATAELYDRATATWASTGGMHDQRIEFTATLLPSGQVLAAGGSNGPAVLTSAELYDPVSGTWLTTTSMTGARVLHTATSLGNTVLVIGGFGGGFGDDPAGAELYDPVNATWVMKAKMAAKRASHVAVQLEDGRVLVAGGTFSGAILSSTELFDPSVNKWVSTASMLTARWEHTATLLQNGQVLVAGGSGVGSVSSSAERFDPATGLWKATGSMTTSARAEQTATLLQNGVVLAAGGFDLGSLASSEIYSYDLTTGSWCFAGNMNVSRGRHTATLLQNGQVLVAGGLSSSLIPPTATAQLYNTGLCASCDDGSLCTADSCNASTGCCEHTNTDTCGNGVCGPDEAFCSCPADCGGVDTDGDGLSDLWETQGIDVNCDGVPDLDLPAMGADPLHKDVFVQIDYMVSLGSPYHNHKPAPDAMSALFVAFANAPVTNPDNTAGINLHVVLGNALLHWNNIKFGPITAQSGTDAVNFYDLKALYFDPARRKAFRYAIFGHFADPAQCPFPLQNCGGIAAPGDDLLITLGGLANLVGTADEQATTFMHELGHDFLLQHGGDSSDPSQNDKPNYLSVMNYRFSAGVPTTIGGLPAPPRLDYSRQKLPALDENNLDEAAGIGDGVDQTTFTCLFGETPANCPSDCPSCACGNGVCQPQDCGENEVNCPGDCPACGSACGDGYCQRQCGETDQTCPKDCPTQNNTCLCGINNNHVCEPSCKLNTKAVGNGQGGIDWNCNGTPNEVGVKANISGDADWSDGINPAGVFTVLTGFNDWANLEYKFQCTAGYANLSFEPPPELIGDLDSDVLKQGHFLYPTKHVTIDVFPGCSANPIVVGGPGMLPIAVLSEPGFDATTVIPTSLMVASASPESTTTADVDGDGALDLVATFDMSKLFLGASATELALYGTLPSSQSIYGTDSITLVPSLMDSDGDGVIDPCDACPGTAPGTLVGPSGCSLANQPPVAACSDVVVAADATCRANASVDAGSSDPDGNPLTVVQIPPGPYPLGSTAVVLAVSDGQATSTCAATVTVLDTSAPSLSVSLAPNVLWPPNHKLVTIQATFQALDNCDPHPIVALVSATSNEPDDAPGLGDGNTTGDVQAVDAAHISLRAERDGKGTGRTYTLTFSATDASQNTVLTVATVLVPHDP